MARLSAPRLVGCRVGEAFEGDVFVLPVLAMLVANPDRLEIDGSMGIGASSVAMKRWLTPEMYRDVEMVCTPSFQPEVAVFILRPEKFAKKKGSAVVVVRQPVTPIHDALREAMPKERFANENGEGEWARLAAAELGAAAAIRVEVTEVRAPIDEETIKALEDLWGVALEEARFREPNPSWVRLDGETCTFADFARGDGERRASTWSPMEGSRMHALIATGRRLIAYAKSSPGNREVALADLRASVAVARRLFEPGTPTRQR